MRPSKAPLTLLLLVCSLGIAAQTRRRPASRPAAATPAVQPAAPTSPTPQTKVAATEPRAPIPLVIVNGQTITTGDIDQSVRTETDKLDDKIAETRKQVVELQINTVLLEVEAKKRRTTSQQLYDVEVARKVTEPTQAEIDNFIAQNRSQLDESDDIRPKVAGYLRAEKESKISSALVTRLKTTNPVSMGVDINSPNLAPTTIIATVSGQPITAATINERLKPLIYKLRLNAYTMQKEAADRTIDDMLLLAEANRRNIGPEEIIRAEVSQKVHTPTEAEVNKFYSDNRQRIKGELSEVRNQLAMYLQDEDQRRLERALSERLRKGANIRWLISEPSPPVQNISTDDDPSRGSPNAAATVVEFTDFQCPACAAMQPVLEQVLGSYGDKVRFVVRDFPLTIHANAKKAAEAANAAYAQGKFFEYASLLFKRQNALDVASLKKYATELKLDRARFDAELDNGTYAAEVRHDMNDGEIYGVDSTPTIFVNGVRLDTLNAEALRAAIDRALAGNAPKP